MDPKTALTFTLAAFFKSKLISMTKIIKEVTMVEIKKL